MSTVSDARTAAGAIRRTTLSGEALDFAPGLLAIQESPPERLRRVVMYCVVGLVATLLVWAAWGKLDIVASAEGRLVPQTYVKIVQPSEAGIVKEILVREGETVSAGQVLMRMDPQLAEADWKTLESDLALKSLQLARIDAELAGAAFAPRTGLPADLRGRIEAQLHDRRQAYEDSLAQARDALRKARMEHEAAQQVMAKLREVTPILRDQAQAYADLGGRGFAPQMMVRDKEREYLEKGRDLQAQEATVQSLAAAIAAAEKQVSQITSRYRSELQNERVEAEGQYRRLLQDRAKQAHRVALLELRAPQAGVVKDLATHTVGTVVSPGTVLLSLVPETEPLVAEVTVKNDDVGFVLQGQTARVKIVPYPFEKYGMLEGKVFHVGPDAAEAEARGQTREAVPATQGYKARVRLAGQVLESPAGSLRLVAGMQVIAEINLGRRTVLEYMLSPVQRTVHDSARER